MACKIHWSTPDDDAETLLRIRPLREQWEARGPGLLGRLQSRLPWLKLPDDVTVHLINPVVGGAGYVRSDTEIEFEAVLANPWPMLPEVARLGWLIACLNPTESEREPIGLIPAIISAAEYVELARLDDSAIECALLHWFGETDHLVDQLTAGSLLIWWESNQEEVRDLAGWRTALDQF